MATIRQFRSPGAPGFIDIAHDGVTYRVAVTRSSRARRITLRIRQEPPNPSSRCRRAAISWSRPISPQGMRDGSRRASPDFRRKSPLGPERRCRSEASTITSSRPEPCAAWCAPSASVKWHPRSAGLAGACFPPGDGVPEARSPSGPRSGGRASFLPRPGWKPGGSPSRTPRAAGAHAPPTEPCRFPGASSSPRPSCSIISRRTRSPICANSPLP